ncbi:hypothetical protein [Frankia sp. Cj3]|uniref:hypothetical protein n=1 Tax=Frankia sp. Cj3 TaxID=2880976 RepID=UPI001EF6674D|nr:hypothetical protein [Frankia sp. Cj3]
MTIGAPSHTAPPVGARERHRRPVLVETPDAADNAPAARLLALQRSAGNRAVTALVRLGTDAPGPAAVRRVLVVQREPTRSDLLAALRASIAAADWKDVAVRLNGFNEADIRDLSARLSVAQATNTRAAVEEHLAGWPHQPLILQSLDAGRAQVARLGEIMHAFDAAATRGDWAAAAVQLTQLSDADMAHRLAPLTWQQKMELKAVCGDNARIPAAIERSETARVGRVFAAYEAAIRAHDWRSAVDQLNGMSQADIRTRVAALDDRALAALASAAQPGNARELVQAETTRRRPTEIDLDAVSPEEQERLQSLGIQLPTVSAGAVDPRSGASYVDRAVQAVGYSIYQGGFALYLNGIDMPVLVPEPYFDFGGGSYAPADVATYGSREEAVAAVPFGPQAPGQARPYAYYRAVGGLTVPTVFADATTPRTVQTARQAVRELVREVQHELVILAVTLVGGMALRAVLRRLVRVGGGEGEAAAGAELGTPAAQARRFAQQLTDEGKPVVANMGGAGAPHEPVDAININNQAVARRGIPNHVNADAADIGELFDPGTVDRVEAYRMAPEVVDWSRGVPGIKRVLRPGGTFTYRYQGGGNEDARLLERLLRANGFNDVQNLGDAVVTATRP